MAGLPHDVHHRLLAPVHIDALVDELHLPPLALHLVLVRTGRVDSLYEQVLRVVAEVGNAPGDAVVVADDDAGKARKGEPAHLSPARCRGHEAAGLVDDVEPHLVPDRGHLHREVGVVDEDRPAALGPLAGDDPGVGALAPATACDAQPPWLRRRLGSRFVRVEAGAVAGPEVRVPLPASQHERHVIAVRRVVLLGPGKAGGPQKFDEEPLGGQVRIERPGHELGPGQAVGRPPRLDLHLHAAEREKRVLEAHPARLAVADARVDAGNVGIECAPGVVVEELVLLLGDALEPQRTQEDIGLERRLAEELRQSAASDAPLELHLPEAVLRVHESVCEVEVLDRPGVDVGYAEAVADDFHGILEAGDPQRPPGFGKGTSGQEDATRENKQNRERSCEKDRCLS